MYSFTPVQLCPTFPPLMHNPLKAETLLLNHEDYCYPRILETILLIKCKSHAILTNYIINGIILTYLLTFSRNSTAECKSFFRKTA